MTEAEGASFSTAPPFTGWDNDVEIQKDAIDACRRSGDRLGEARHLNALGMVCNRRGYHPAARDQFEESLGILAGLGDARWAPVVRMHLAEALLGLAFCREAEDILAESLAFFRARGDGADEAEALRLLSEIEKTLEPYRAIMRAQKHAETSQTSDSTTIPAP